MSDRKRPIPLNLAKLDAAIPRLRKNFPRLEDMKRDAARRHKGYIGELTVDYYLDFLSSQFLILKDIHLNMQGKTVQFDSIVITNYGIFCIESKNVNGKITFDTILKQFIQHDGVTERSYRYPITQAETQRLQLSNWLHFRNYQNIPVYYFIAISEPSTIINVKGDEQAIAKVVAHAEHIPQMILKTDRKLQGRSRLPMRQIANEILHESKKHDSNILSKYGVQKSDILPGVHCPQCGWLGMNRIYNNWHCPKCNHRSRHAHKRAFADYFLLINPWITNAECRRFLKINSRNLATNLIKKEDLIYQKERKRWIKH